VLRGARAGRSEHLAGCRLSNRQHGSAYRVTGEPERRLEYCAATFVLAIVPEQALPLPNYFKCLPHATGSETLAGAHTSEATDLPSEKDSALLKRDANTAMSLRRVEENVLLRQPLERRVLRHRQVHLLA
jgi:hypothetical protein